MVQAGNWEARDWKVGGHHPFPFLRGAAAAESCDPLPLAIMLPASLAAALIRVLFPSSRLIPIAFGNLIAVYHAIFSLFVAKIFFAVKRWTLGGFWRRSR
ncbi:MAG TPA: hypothetical protein VFG05_08880 [Methylocella sp.]|nr:hypothetical protein [Methylocella sp.]